MVIKLESYEQVMQSLLTAATTHRIVDSLDMNHPALNGNVCDQCQTRGGMFEDLKGFELCPLLFLR